MMGIDARARHRASRWFSKTGMRLRQMGEVLAATLAVLVLATAFLMTVAVGSSLINGGDPAREFLWTGR